MQKLERIVDSNMDSNETNMKRKGPSKTAELMALHRVIESHLGSGSF
jgi:hypothetical protein